MQPIVRLETLSPSAVFDHCIADHRWSPMPYAGRFDLALAEELPVVEFQRSIGNSAPAFSLEAATLPLSSNDRSADSVGAPVVPLGADWWKRWHSETATIEFRQQLANSIEAKKVNGVEPPAAELAPRDAVSRLGGVGLAMCLICAGVSGAQATRARAWLTTLRERVRPLLDKALMLMARQFALPIGVANRENELDQETAEDTTLDDEFVCLPAKVRGNPTPEFAARHEVPSEPVIQPSTEEANVS
jgi:hypothetical protein